MGISIPLTKKLILPAIECYKKLQVQKKASEQFVDTLFAELKNKYPDGPPQNAVTLLAEYIDNNTEKVEGALEIIRIATTKSWDFLVGTYTKRWHIFLPFVYQFNKQLRQDYAYIASISQSVEHVKFDKEFMRKHTQTVQMAGV